MAAALLLSLSAWAQEPGNSAGNDVVSSHGDLLFDGPAARHCHMDECAPAEANYGAPRRSFGRSGNVSQWFLESKMLVGAGQVGYGLQGAYVPYHWGGYTSYAVAGSYDEYDMPYRTDWFSAGAVFRPLTYPAAMDFQLYCGVAVGDGCGVEYGLRLASATRSPFSWFSFTIGGIQTPYYHVVTFGFSIGITGVVCLPILL